MPKSAYERAGVSIDRGNEAVERIKSMVKRMGVQEIGKFGGFFPLKGGLKNPILVSSADGVGTKLKIAFLTGVHNTVGRDLVNHCVNDILVYGARPLFFLDYLASRQASSPRSSARSSPGCWTAAWTTKWSCWAGRPRKCPGFTRKANMTSPVSSSASWARKMSWTAKASARATCWSACPRPGCTPTAIPWPATSFLKSSI